MARIDSAVVEALSRLTLPSIAGGVVSFSTLLVAAPRLVVHVDRPSEAVAYQWAQLAPRLASLGYRVTLALAGRAAWRLRGRLPQAPMTVLIDDELALSRLLGAVKRLPIPGLPPRVEPATLVLSRINGEVAVEAVKGAEKGFSHALWALEAASRLSGQSREYGVSV